MLIKNYFIHKNSIKSHHAYEKIIIFLYPQQKKRKILQNV